MTFASVSQFHAFLPWGQRPFSIVNSVLNVEALVGAFNQEKALVGAFSVIWKTNCGNDEALHSTTWNQPFQILIYLKWNHAKKKLQFSPHIQKQFVLWKVAGWQTQINFWKFLDS